MNSVQTLDIDLDTVENAAIYEAREAGAPYSMAIMYGRLAREAEQARQAAEDNGEVLLSEGGDVVSPWAKRRDKTRADQLTLAKTLGIL